MADVIVRVGDPQGDPIERVVVFVKAVGAGREPVFMDGGHVRVGELELEPDEDGLVTLSLTPNSELIPANSFYRIGIETRPDRKRQSFAIVVPPGAGPFNAEDILHEPGTVDTPALALHRTTEVHTQPQPPIIGPGATEAVAGNDPRLSDARVPTGGAGGVLSGDYPSPGFAVDMATQEELDNRVTKLVIDALGIDAATLEGLTLAQVQTQIVAVIVDASPETLNTLNELAAALGDDPNFVTTITTLIGTKASQTDVDTLDGRVDDAEGALEEIGTFDLEALPLIAGPPGPVVNMNDRYFNCQPDDDVSDEWNAALADTDVREIVWSKPGDYLHSVSGVAERPWLKVVNRPGVRHVIDGRSVYILKSLNPESVRYEHWHLKDFNIYDPDPVHHVNLEESQGLAPRLIDRLTIDGFYSNNLGDESIDAIGCRSVLLKNIHVENGAVISDYFLTDRAGSPKKTLVAIAVPLGYAGRGYTVSIEDGPSAARFTAIVKSFGVEVERYTDMASPADLAAASALSVHVLFHDLNSATAAPDNNPAVITDESLTTGDGAISCNVSERFHLENAFGKDIGVANFVRVEVGGAPGSLQPGKVFIDRVDADGCGDTVVKVVPGSNGDVQDITVGHVRGQNFKKSLVALEPASGAIVDSASLHHITGRGGGDDASAFPSHRGMVNVTSGVLDLTMVDIKSLKDADGRGWGTSRGHHGIRARHARIFAAVVVDAADCGIFLEDTTESSIVMGPTLRDNGQRAGSGDREAILLGAATDPSKIIGAVQSGNFNDYDEPTEGIPVFLGNPGVNVLWANMPAALSEVLGNTGRRFVADLRNASEVRLAGYVSTPGAATAELRLQFWDGAAWQYFDGIGPAISLASSGAKGSAWAPVPADALQESCMMRIVGVDGDGAADPNFTMAAFAR